MNENKTNINWFPGHMQKTKREILEKLSLIDIVYEVIDARMPISSKIVDIDSLIQNKPRVLIATKYDLCDKLETNKILDDYRNKGYYVISLDLINQDVKPLIEITKKIMNEINEKRNQKGLNSRASRILIVGAPNVGKSTLINRLVGKKAVGVGNTPGFTKSLSWIRINQDMELLDSPGILWPKLDNQEHAHNLAAFSSIKEEILNKDDIACYILKKLYEYYPEQLFERYGIETIDDDFIEAYEIIGRRRGALSKGGVVDYDRVSDLILQDLKNGYFKNITFDRLK